MGFNSLTSSAIHQILRITFWGKRILPVYEERQLAVCQQVYLEKNLTPQEIQILF